MRLDIAARKYLGVPFLHQGRNPRIGIDCVGLLVLSAIDCGLQELAACDFTSYSDNPSRGQLEVKLREAFGEPVEHLAPGDVVSVNFIGMTRHVGIIGEKSGRLILIHTYKAPAKVIEHGIDDKWRKRITGIYRMEGL